MEKSEVTVMKHLPFTRKKKTFHISPGDFRKCRNALAACMVLTQLDKLIVAAARAYAIVRKANHEYK